MLTVEQVLDKVSFPVGTERLVTVDGGIVRKTLAVVRKDINEVVGIVSERYKLIPHALVLEKPLQEMERKGFQFKRVLIKGNGEVVIVEAMGTQAFHVNGDEIFQRVLIANSYDCTRALQFYDGAFRIACSNGLVVPYQMFRNFNLALRRKHIGDIQNDLDTILNRVGEFGKIFSQVIDFYQNLSDRKVDFDTAKKLVKEVYASNKTVTSILNLWKAGDGHQGKNSAWELYNGLVQFQRDKERGGKEDGLATKVLRHTDIQMRFLEHLAKN